MVEKTIDVYKKSEESKKMMTSVLVAKDTQLQAASEQIDRMSQLQKRLMEESHILTGESTILNDCIQVHEFAPHVAVVSSKPLAIC